MDKQKLLDAAKAAVKVEGLKVTLDGKQILIGVVEEAISELVADTSNPYDDKLWALLKPLLDAKLATV
jgi:hypothetical protein